MTTLYPTVNTYSTVPYIYQPTQTVISASTLTPNTTLAVPLLPTVASIMPTLPNYPLFPSVFTYQDVNADSNLRRQVTEMFFEKVLKNWMKYHYLDLYSMVTVSGKSAQLVTDVNQVKTNTKSDPVENSIKYEFIIDNFLLKVKNK
jgi:hypothetical protein